jgi:hypothetical protein
VTATVASRLALAGREVAAAHRPAWPRAIRWAPIDDKLEAAVLDGDEAEALEAIADWRCWWLTRGPSWERG